MHTLGVIFDMDGVLVDSKPAHFASWQASAADRGFSLDQAQYDRLFGHGYQVFIRELADGHLDAEAALEWYHDKEARYRAIVRTRPPVMPGAEDLLVALDEAGFGLAIGSAGPRGNVELIQQSMREGQRFRLWLSADDVTHPKPAPDVFLACAKGLGCAPEHCLVVEDSLHGLAAARA
ncbi:MAG: HAD family phosphatase, partial [Planctomycetota bacterium]|nr:HAD family phosphatase [Planctomycetota bacterium]